MKYINAAFITNVQHKIIFKRSCQKEEKLLLIFVEIVYDGTPNFQKIVYRPNHWVIITDTQLKVYLHIYP